MTEGVLEFKIPMLPPSMNSMYSVSARGSQVRFFLKSEWRRFKEQAKMFMPRMKFPEECLFSIEIKVHKPWMCKNGAVKKEDIMNLDKVLCDAVAEKYVSGKDERFWARKIEKVQDSDEFVSVRVSILAPSAGSPLPA